MVRFRKWSITKKLIFWNVVFYAIAIPGVIWIAEDAAKHKQQSVAARTVEITLKDGTRCAVYRGSIQCDWK